MNIRQTINDIRVRLALAILGDLPAIANVTLGGPLIMQMESGRDGAAFKDVTIYGMDLDASQRDCGILFLTSDAFEKRKRRRLWLGADGHWLPREAGDGGE